MERATAEEVIQYLEKELFLGGLVHKTFSPGSYFVTTSFSETGTEAEKVQIFKNEQRICGWVEAYGELYVNRELVSKEQLLEKMRKRALKCPEISRCILEMIKQQREEIERLRNKNRKLKYLPEGRGALNAQKHFKVLSGQQ